MKRIFYLFVCFFLFSFISCVFVKTGDDNNSGNNPDNGGENPIVQEDKGIVSLNNKSDYSVNVYLGQNRYIGTFVGTVPAKGTKDYSYSPSDDSIGDYFWFEYLIKIGNATFPYCSEQSSSGYKNIKISINEKKTLDIDELLRCETKSAYFLIENKSSSSIRLMNASSLIHAAGTNDVSIDTGKDAVYEIGYKDTEVTLGSIGLVKIRMGTTDIAIPVTNKDVVAGNIYTISVNTDEKGVSTASLKAVTPFNIDTQNKIWSLDNSIFSTEYPVAMRPSYDGKATLVIGTARSEPQKIGIGRIDEYGKYSTGTDNFVAFNDNPNHTATQIVDFVEQQDGSVVMLCNQIFKTGDIISENYVIVCYDFASKTLKWYKVIPSSVQVSAEDDSYYMLVFRNDSKNKLIQIAEDKFVCVGAYDNYAFNAEGEFDYDRLHYMIMYIDGTNTNSEHVVAPEAIKTIVSTDYSDLAKGIERNLTSAYFDGTDLFICGYENWNHPVKNEKGEIDDEGYNTTHVGKIWKVSPSDIEAGNYDFENNVVYSCNNCLFFSIDGTGSNYVVCGEYKDTGKVLKGCHVTSSMIKADSSCTPVKYTVPGKQSCWFNQLCQYGSKIVLCGKAADSFDGSESPLPFVVAYDSKGNKLWENLSFTNYTSALNIIPNTIGTYMLQLEGKNGIIHYVNADLLGNEKK